MEIILVVIALIVVSENPKEKSIPESSGNQMSVIDVAPDKISDVSIEHIDTKRGYLLKNLRYTNELSPEGQR